MTFVFTGSILAGMNSTSIISRELGLKENQTSSVISLLDQGASIPFIARYRKESTGSLDEVVLTQIRDRLEQINLLNDRKNAIIKSLTERDLLKPDLKAQINSAQTMTTLEDLYEKYRPKKKTRASMAVEKGLQPLADSILNGQCQNAAAEAKQYLSQKRGVETIDDALTGARDIIAQGIAEDTSIRSDIRSLFLSSAQITSSVKKAKIEDAQKFKDYFDWSEPAFKSPSHRILAMLRGKNEGMLNIHVLPDEKKAVQCIEYQFLKKRNPCMTLIKEAILDGYKRLLSKSIETESLKALKLSADKTAIQVFASNVKELFLAPPLGQKKTLAIDPGFRTGCKVVCLDGQGKLTHHDVIYPHQTNNDGAAQTIRHLVQKFRIEAIAIGNGTAGRETESFIRKLELDQDVDIVMVDESGASIYSASKTAREEFPDHDITVRGAVSIGRRLMDPLAELVKLDPKSIGVGQYQHDVDQKLLQTALDDVVISCVNRVGVEVNTASKELLARVSGLNATIAANIVTYRDENGPFKQRKALLKVPRLGPKAFEQSAGFLRIHDAANPLDQSGIHPESYAIVKQMAKDLNTDIKNLLFNSDKIKQIRLDQYRTDTIGMPTLKDILKELANPGRDPRKKFKTFKFDDTIHDIKDLVPGMTVPGIVTNVTAFGAFVDIGVHQDGLVHISQLADHFVKDPHTVVSVRQHVTVKILDVDISRKRISLSMKKG